MFLLCLESVYRKLTGRELQYRALLGKPGLLTYQYAERQLRRQNHDHKLTTIYAIGDNLMTDIYGANLYNHYLGQQSAAVTTAAKLVARGTGSQVTVTAEEGECGAAQCRSILVRSQLLFLFNTFTPSSVLCAALRRLSQYLTL
ncbi:haloacid dehalogenase-like hydrolase domain-containing 5 [Plectropomus leopardus]|uniref:haloacid dehalogenase-like hydrolase domain-containing 5 n=1 Tax=Plectropomus leopardus TaxID=160734 RepID=UPI001C4DBDD0|nr:haloacid dehalogenase-like hydrolase domain-containing 5 [Plectropomus leopardus]